MRVLHRLFLILLLAPVSQAPGLLDSAPVAGEVLTQSPAEVSLTFDAPVTAEQVQIRVRDANGVQVDNGDTTLDETNPNRVSVTLPPLPEGAYFVEYDVTPEGQPTVTASFSFMVIAPPPRLTLLSPADGDVVTGGVLTLDLAVDAFSLDDEGNAVRLVVDGSREADFNDSHYTLQGLEPGVHRVEVVLVSDGEELEATRAGVYVAVPQPDPEAEGRLAAMTATPDPGLRLAPWQIAVVAGLGLAAFGVGIWLGRSRRRT